MNKDIGKRIKKIRLLKNIDPKQLADEIGVRHTSLAKIEREGTNSVETLMKIADALKVDIAELFEEPAKVIESNGEYGYITKHEFDSKLSEIAHALLKLTKTVERIEDRIPAFKSSASKIPAAKKPAKKK